MKIYIHGYLSIYNATPLGILINSYEDMYPMFKQEAAKKAGQL